MDGASHWQQFRHVALPGIRNQLVFVAAVTTILYVPTSSTKYTW